MELFSTGINIPYDEPILAAIRTVNGDSKRSRRFIGAFLCLRIEGNVIAIARLLWCGVGLITVGAMQLIR
jgi:hypothetical protein